MILQLGPSLQNEAAPSLAGQISQSSEAQVRSKQCALLNIGQSTFDRQNPVLGWIKHCYTLLFVGIFHQIVQDFVHRPDPPLQALLEDLDEDEFEEACSA